MINDSGECSKILKTIVQDGSMSGLKSQLSIKHTKVCQKLLVGVCRAVQIYLGNDKSRIFKFQSGLKEA